MRGYRVAGKGNTEIDETANAAPVESRDAGDLAPNWPASLPMKPFGANSAGGRGVARNCLSMEVADRAPPQPMIGCCSERPRAMGSGEKRLGRGPANPHPDTY